MSKTAAVSGQVDAPKRSRLRENVEAILIAVVIALFIRTFVVQAFKIPSGSMVPTLLVGDHIFVNKFIYGLRVPLTEKWLFHWQEPKRGDVIVFMYPQDRSKDFIKRVVGLPGDTVEIRNGELLVTNAQGQRVPIEVVTTATDFLYEEELEGQRLAIPCLQVEESLDGTKIGRASCRERV